MGNNMDAKNILKPHSEAKVKLLSKYLNIYLSVIGNVDYVKRIKIYDLFCGEGLYDNDKEGSPLVILKALEELYYSSLEKEKKIPIAECHFNDIDHDNIKKLKEVVEAKSFSYPKLEDIVFTVGDYREEIKKVINYFEQYKYTKGFIFIDPYGYSDIRFSEIKTLLNKGNTEILLFLPIQFMYRFDNDAAPSALINFIKELSINYSEWQNPNNPRKYVSQLTGAFRDYLGDKFFVDTFLIEKDAQTVFCLFFFSSHIYGFEKMIEAKWEIDPQRGKGYTYKGNNPELFSPIYELESKLKKFIEDGKRTNGDVYVFTLRLGFRPKHATDIFKAWQKKQNSNFKVIDSKGNEARKNSFYIKYDDYKNNYSKVHFKLI